MKVLTFDIETTNTFDEVGSPNAEDLDLFSIVDNPTDAVKVIDDFYSKYLLSPNY